MSPRTAGWILFAVLVVTWPWTLVGLEGSRVPVARFAELAIALSILVAHEGAGGMVGTMLLLLWGHVVVYGLVLGAASWLLARLAFARLPVGARTCALAGIVIALLAWGVLGHPYDTLFHHSDAHATLLELYR